MAVAHALINTTTFTHQRPQLIQSGLGVSLNREHFAVSRVLEDSRVPGEAVAVFPNDDCTGKRLKPDALCMRSVSPNCQAMLTRSIYTS